MPPWKSKLFYKPSILRIHVCFPGCWYIDIDTPFLHFCDMMPSTNYWISNMPPWQAVLVGEKKSSSLCTPPAALFFRRLSGSLWRCRQGDWKKWANVTREMVRFFPFILPETNSKFTPENHWKSMVGRLISVWDIFRVDVRLRDCSNRWTATIIWDLEAFEACDACFFLSALLKPTWKPKKGRLEDNISQRFVLFFFYMVLSEMSTMLHHVI